MTIIKKQFSRGLRKTLSVFVLAAFLLNTAVPVYAQSAFVLPVPGEMVHLSAAFTPPLLKAVKVNADNPFAFNFIVDTGSSKMENSELQKESNKLIRYFLASLTTPEDDLWVNLSPYEKDRVVPNSFGVTEMGRDLLAQDYLLKQITSTLMYPEEELGKKFWDTVYQKAYEKFGTTNIMANTFNKVWIVPEKAVVYENGMTAFVSETKLKVMLEEDYVALSNQKDSAESRATARDKQDANNIGSQVVRDIIIPELEKEVNGGKNFASLRQVYSSLILANWYKKRLRDSILTKIYVDKNKVAGVDIEDKAEAQKIYEQYIAAFKKGVYNYIKEDVDPASKEPTPRKYFSGGMNLRLNISKAVETRRGMPPEAKLASSSLIEVDAKFDLSNKGQQTSAFEGGEVRPVSSSSALAKNEYDPVILQDIQERYSQVGWDESLLDWQMFSGKKNDAGQYMLSSLMNRPERNMTRRYRELLREINGIRSVVVNGGFLTDDQISSLRAAEVHFRLVSQVFTEDERRGNNFPTSDLNQVLKALKVTGLKELLDLLEFATLDALVERLADNIPQGWRRLEVLKVLYGGETVNMELARYKARLDILIRERKDGPIGGAIASSAVWENSAVAKLDLSDLDGAMKLVAQRTSEQLRDENQLKQQVLALGHKLKMMAHGVSDSDWLDPYRAFMNIVLEERLPDISGYFNMTALSDQSLFGGRGEYLAVLNPDKYRTSGGSIESPKEDSDFLLFLFPNDEARGLALQILLKAEEQGVITQQKQQDIRFKLATYKEFVDRYSVIVEEQEAQRAAAEVTAAKGRAAPLSLSFAVPGFSEAMISDPVFGLSEKEKAFAMKASGEIAVSLAKSNFKAFGDKNVLIALRPFFDRFSSTYTEDQVGEILNDILKKMSAGLNKEGVTQKYENQIARVFAAYYYKNYHLPVKEFIEIEEDADLQSEFNIGRTSLFNVATIAILGAGLKGFVAITRYPDRRVLLADENPFMVNAFKEYQALTGKQDLQIFAGEMAQPGFGGKVTAQYDQVIVPVLFNSGRSMEERRVILQNAAAVLYPGNSLQIYETFNADKLTIAEQAKDEVEEILRSSGLVVRMANLMRVSGASLLMQVSAVHASSAVAELWTQDQRDIFKQVRAAVPANAFSRTASSSLVPEAIQEEMAVRDQIAKAMISRFGLDLNRYAGGAEGLYQYSKILAHRIDIPEQGLGDQVFLPRFIDDVFARAKEIGGATTAKIVFLEAGARPLYDAANLMARISNAYPLDSLKDVWATMGHYREMKADPEQAVLFIKYLVDQGVISGQPGQPQKLLFVDTDTGFSDLGTALIFTKTLLDPDVIKKANEKFGLSIQPFNESPDGNTLEIMYMFSDYNVSPQKWARHIRQDKISPAVEQKLQIKGYNSKEGTSLTNYISWTWNQLDLFVKTASVFDRFSLNSRTGRVSVRRKEPYNQAYLDLDKLKAARALQDAGLLKGVLDVMQTRGYDVAAEFEKLMRDLQGTLSQSGLSQAPPSASSGLEFNRENVAARVDRLKNIFKIYDRGILDYIKGGVAQISFLSRKVVHRMDDPIGLNDQVFLPKFIDAIFDKAGKLGKPEETKIVFLEAGAKPLYDAARLTNQFTKQYPADQLKSVWATMGNYEAMQDDPEQGVLFIKYLVDQGVLTPETKNLLIVDTDIGGDNLGTALVFTRSLLDPETLRKANERFGLNIAPFNEGGNNLEFLYMYSDYVSNPKKWAVHINMDGISPAMEKKLRVASYNVSGQATLTNYIADWWSAVDSFVKTGSIARRFSLDAATGKAVVTEQEPYQQDSEDIRVLKLARAVEDTTLALSMLDVLEARGYDVTAEADKLFKGLEEAYINSGLIPSGPAASSAVGQPDINKVEARHARVQSVIQKYDYGILDHIDTVAGLYARGASVVHTVDNPIPLFDDQVFLPKFLDAAFDKAKSFGDKAATKMVFLEAGARPLYDAAQLMAQAAGDFPVENLKSIWATMGNYLAIRSDREQAILFIKYLVDQGVLTPGTKHLVIVDTDTGQMSRNPRLQDSPIGTALIFAKTLLVEDILAEANQRYGFNIQPFNAGEGGNTLDILYMYSDYNATTTAQMKQQRWVDHVRVSQISPEVAARLHLEGFNQGVDEGINNYIGDLWFPVDSFTKTENIAERFSVNAVTGKAEVTPAALYDQASDDVRELKLARAIEDTGLRIAMLDVLEARGYDVMAQEKIVLGDLEAAYKNSGLLDEEYDTASSPLTPGGIDLKADKLNLDIRGAQTPIRFNFDTQQLQNLQFDGLVPVIINMTPVVNLPMFLSANASSDDQNS